ncbi:MAG: cell surface glycoprotein (s-layer protein) related protein [Armatimonadetes bacterium]|jgi:hypothetical protein|nr:cell surface glycoprotein (s-layer protein) related protein [Armatimonadota bacterium]
MRERNAKSLLGILIAVGAAGAVMAGHSTLTAGQPVDALARSGQPSTPLLFEANQGQTDSRVRFHARGRGGSLFLTGNEAVVALHGAGNQQTGVVRMGLRGARAKRVRGLEPAGVPVRYYRGRVATKPQPPVTTYRKVQYDNVYPGVDLVYYGNEGALEYDLVVAPGASPREIALSFSGQERLDLDERGALRIRAADRELLQEPPVAYQELNGVRQPVDARFVLQGEREVAFELGAYDPSRKLVIDPKLSFSTFAGGNGAETGTDITTDAAGNTYATGTTASANFPVTGDAYQPLPTAGSEIYINKYSPTGALLYATFLGGHGSEEGGGIAVGADGQVYVSGATTAEDFPITFDCAQPDLADPWDAFVARLDADGQVTYATYLGGGDEDRGLGVAVDDAGLIYVVGRTKSINFPAPAPGRNGFQPTATNNYDGFLVQLDPNELGAAQVLYASYLGGSRVEEAKRIVIHDSQVYLVGSSTSLNFPTSVGALQRSKSGILDVPDAWIGQFDLSQTGANSRVWITYLGGTGSDTGEGIAVNSQGNVYIAGATTSRDFPKKTTPSAGFNYTFGGGAQDGYYAVINPTGSALLRSSYIGGSSDDAALDIAVDPTNFIYITGYASSTNFPLKNHVLPPRGYSDAFVAKLDQANYTLVYSTIIGGTSGEFATAVATDECGINGFITGSTASVANYPVVSAAQPFFGGAAEAGKKLNDAFITKIGAKKDPRVLAKADGLMPLLVKECTGPLTSFTLDGSASQGFNTRITLHRWSLDDQRIAIIPKVVQSKPVGTYRYVLTVTDSVGDSGCAAVTVQIVDTKPPSFTGAGTLCPAGVTVKIAANLSSTNVAIGGPGRAVDKCDGTIIATGTRSDGQALTAPYPLGITNITWTATDSSGNSAGCIQKIIVTH